MRSLLFAVLVVGCGAGYQFDLGAIGAACGVAAITLGLAWNYDHAIRTGR